MKMNGKNLRLKSKSVWGYPPGRFFKFLNRVQKKKLPKTLCILGCSDGTYVLPAAKRGFKVLAIDIDKTAIYGGKIRIANQTVVMEGLLDRLKKDRLERYVEVVNEDFMRYDVKKTYSDVFSSGLIHYRENEKYPKSLIIDKIKSFVSPGGILLLEYIHRSDTANDPKRYFFTKTEMSSFFSDSVFEVTSHKVKSYIEPPNPRNYRIHKITWGRLYAIRNYEKKY